MKYILMLIVVAILIPGVATPREPWPLSRLFKESDAVVVGRITQTSFVGDNANWPGYYVEFRTTVDVELMMKGDDAKTLEVLHSVKLPIKQWPKDSNGIANSPRVIDWGEDNRLFEHDGKLVRVGKERMLLFLRKVKGDYVPTSGARSAIFSAQSLNGTFD